MNWKACDWVQMKITKKNGTIRLDTTLTLFGSSHNLHQFSYFWQVKNAKENHTEGKYENSH